MPRTGVKHAPSARGASALAVVLRLEERGPAIAVEFVSARDLVDARAELWFEALLRQARFDVPLEAVTVEPRPIYRRSSDGTSVCLGFSLSDPERDVRCVFPRTFLEPVAARVARRLFDAGTLAAGDTYTYELCADPAPDSFAPRRALGAEHGRRADSSRAAHAGVRITSGSGLPAAGFSVLRRPIAPLLAQAQPRHADQARPGDYPVFFTRAAHAKAERVARKGASCVPALETGGLLLGPLCSCPETGKLFAVVVEVLEATASQATTYSLTYSGETWARIQTVMRAKGRHPATRGQRILGQVHGHSFLPLEGAAPCAECAVREVCTRTTAFLSADDLAWCRAVFRGEPWQLSQIFGLDARGAGVEAFFGQRGGALVARGYDLIDRFEP